MQRLAGETDLQYRAALSAAYDGPIPPDLLAPPRPARPAPSRRTVVEAEAAARREALRRAVAMLRARRAVGAPLDHARREVEHARLRYRTAVAERRMLRLADACATAAAGLRRGGA